MFHHDHHPVCVNPALVHQMCQAPTEDCRFDRTTASSDEDTSVRVDTFWRADPPSAPYQVLARRLHAEQTNRVDRREG